MDQPTRPLRTEQGKRSRPSQLDEEACTYFLRSKKKRHSPNYLKAILDYHMPDVIKWINLIALLPYLISHGLLTQHERELLKNRTLTEEDRKLELISLIDKKPEGHQKFLEALSEEHEHSGHKEIVKILTGSSKIVPATTQQSSPPLGATSLPTATFEPPTPPREANDCFQVSTPNPVPKYTPITPPEEKTRSPSPPILIRPKSIRQMDKNEEILEGFFMRQIPHKCTERQRNQLGVLLLGQKTYDKVQVEADSEGKTVVELMFHEWITKRGRDANWRELSAAFSKMGHKNLYDRVRLYFKEHSRLYCTYAT